MIHLRNIKRSGNSCRVSNKMKLSFFLPILAAANEHQSEKTEGDRANYPLPRFPCTRQNRVDFEAINNGLSGAIILSYYHDRSFCRHVVQAESSCEEIQIKYRSIAVEPDRLCQLDSFRFGWTDTNGFNVTEPICNCYGDGCQSSIDAYWYDLFFSAEDRLDSDGLTIKSNNFSFYFQSNLQINGGHVIFDWECVRQKTTTTTPSTTTTTTTTTTTM